MVLFLLITNVGNTHFFSMQTLSPLLTLDGLYDLLKVCGFQQSRGDIF